MKTTLVLIKSDRCRDADYLVDALRMAVGLALNPNLSVRAVLAGDALVSYNKWLTDGPGDSESNGLPPGVEKFVALCAENNVALFSHGTLSDSRFKPIDDAGLAKLVLEAETVVAF